MKQSLRQELRAERQNLTDQQKQRASEAIKDKIEHLSFFNEARDISFYLANDNEICPTPIRQVAEYHAKRCYLPVLHPRNSLLYFGRYRSGESLKSNRYGIPEPIATPDSAIAPEDLDVVFVPLVGFDREGHRLGMGGGYYDRTFSFCNQTSERPLLVGLAYSFQENQTIPEDDWDIALDMVITEQEVIMVSNLVQS